MLKRVIGYIRMKYEQFLIREMDRLDIFGTKEEIKLMDEGLKLTDEVIRLEDRVMKLEEALEDKNREIEELYLKYNLENEEEA